MGLTKKGRELMFDARFLHATTPETVWLVAPLTALPADDGTGWAVPTTWSNWNVPANLQFGVSDLSLSTNRKLLTVTKSFEFGQAVVTGASPSVVGIGLFNSAMSVIYGFAALTAPVTVNAGDTTRVVEGGFVLAMDN